MTQAEAHRALDEFLALADAAGQRCVLVITGKGGVLRAGVPRWINEQPSRSRVLAVMPAQPKDGGAGALYILLRRRR
jgi:DNA-nicking Smr family endonuclease